MTTKLQIITPDDWHLHLRDGPVMAAVLPQTSFWCNRAIVMPNLVPPVVTGADAAAYRNRITEVLDARANFMPLMTLYLTEQTDTDDLTAAVKSGIATAVKLYPAGATTNSASGVKDINKVMPVLEVLAEAGAPLLVHGEVTDPDIDIFDREAVFIERVLAPLHQRLPQLKIVFEHITTRQAVEFVAAANDQIAATVTPHHLIINRNAYLAGGIKPHYYCLPVAKREIHRLALLDAVLSETGKFFLGTDSAPHLDTAKLQPCGCAGIFNAPNTVACLAQLFDNAGRIELLEGFTSIYGPQFYGLDVNSDRLTLVKHDSPQPLPQPIQTDEGPITVFDPQMDVFWSVETA
jgi:dihydroorotase